MEENTFGEHYGGGGYCNAGLNKRWHGTAGHTCEANLSAALAAYGLGRYDFDGDTSLNVFMKPPAPDWTLHSTPAGPHDFIVLRALMDQIVAVSNCPATSTPTNWGSSKALRLEVTNSADPTVCASN
jgi:uncharacterized protein YcgI (DUF1989 family)